MLFNTIEYAFFLPLVFILYWYNNRNIKVQNLLLLISSYYFYSCWDLNFVFLLFFSTLLDFFIGLKIYKEKNKNLKKFWFWFSIIINLGILGVFKYYNFFISSFADAFSMFGLNFSIQTLNLILPVGISFYTFHGLSYIIDVYKERIKAESSFINYALFVSFFPLLVAGPIERASHLLPQIKNKRNFNYINTINGLRQILWGLFKKIVIADNCALYANQIFNNFSELSGSTLFLGALFFTFQIYGDFSGYSDIALGSARLFGFELLQNFSYPYFSRDIAEFWRRWHISLSSWFRDYVYIPLGGNRGSHLIRIRNLFVIFFLSGVWHGANWTFIVWGGVNALLILPSFIFKTNRNNLEIVAHGKLIPSFKDLVQIFITFNLTVITWVFFRAVDIESAFKYISGIFSKTLFTFPYVKEVDTGNLIFPKKLLFLLFIFILIEWIGRHDNYAISHFLLSYNRFLRWIFYMLLIVLIFYFCNFNENVFIYFQF